jgi:hypothetical protein
MWRLSQQQRRWQGATTVLIADKISREVGPFYPWARRAEDRHPKWYIHPPYPGFGKKDIERIKQMGRQAEDRKKLAARGSWRAGNKVSGPIRGDNSITEPPTDMAADLQELWRDTRDGLIDKGIWDSRDDDLLTLRIQVGEMLKRETRRPDPSVESTTKLGGLYCRLSRELGLSPSARQALKAGPAEESVPDTHAMRFFTKPE